MALVAGVAYIAGGFALARALGASAHPHQQTWRNLGGLVADGVAFSKGLSRHRGPRVYTAVPQAKPVERSQSKEHKSKKQSETDRGSERKRARAVRSPEKPDSGGTKTESDAPLAAEQQLVAGTPAGGGGRWVHVPT